MKKRHERFVLLAAIVLTIAMCIPCMASAADGEPTLRFALTTEDAVTGLSPGDQIRVNVTVGREDQSLEAYRLYSVMLDIDYDKDLFDVSELKTSGLKRPDGAAWTGRWTCNSILDGKRIRVLYVNIGGLMSSPPVLDTVSGTFTAAFFVLTVKENAQASDSAVKFAFTENGGPNAQKGPSTAGDGLSLKITGAGGNSGGNGDSGNGGGSGSGGSGSGSSGSNGSGSGAGGSGSGSGGSGGSGSGGSGSNGSGSGSGGADSSGSGAGSGTGSNGTGSGSGTDSNGSNPGAAVTFEELKDIDGAHWAADYVKYLVSRGIVSGNEDKEFQPEKPVTRAEFAQMVVSAFGYDTKTAAGRFQDVTEADWYARPVTALYEAGIVSGVDEARFGSEETLTRQDMAVILYKVLLDQNITLPAVKGYEDFRDEAQIADYARRAVWEMVCTGIMSGTDERMMEPEQPSTRAEVATVLTNILRKLEK